MAHITTVKCPRAIAKRLYVIHGNLLLNAWLRVAMNICGLFKRALFAGVHGMDIPETPKI